MNINDYWTGRRTVRRYSEREVTDELLNRMLEEAAHAPTTGNMQLYSVIVTRGEEAKQALAPAHFNQPQVMGCDVVLTFCADFNRFSRWCENRDAEPCSRSWQPFWIQHSLPSSLIQLPSLTGLGVACWEPQPIMPIKLPRC